MFKDTVSVLIQFIFDKCSLGTAVKQNTNGHCPGFIISVGHCSRLCSKTFVLSENEQLKSVLFVTFLLLAVQDYSYCSLQ